VALLNVDTTAGPLIELIVTLTCCVFTSGGALSE